jgi:hypothetical protein
MAHVDQACPQGNRVMKAPTSSAQSSTPQRTGTFLPAVPAPANEEDVAIGCECANPALQIECWGAEATAQPLHPFY